MGSPLHTFLETLSVGWTGVVLGGGEGGEPKGPVPDFRTPHSQRQRSAQVRTPRASNTAIRITIDDHVLAR